jgi:hypothetical protein
MLRTPKRWTLAAFDRVVTLTEVNEAFCLAAALHSFDFNKDDLVRAFLKDVGDSAVGGNGYAFEDRCPCRWRRQVRPRLRRRERSRAGSGRIGNTLTHRWPSNGN